MIFKNSSVRNALNSTSVVQNYFYGLLDKNGKKIKFSKNKKYTPKVLATLWKNTKKKETALLPM